MRMRQENHNFETEGRDQTAVKAENAKLAPQATGVPLEAREFERLLERAAEMLRIRGRIAA